MFCNKLPQVPLKNNQVTFLLIDFGLIPQNNENKITFCSSQNRKMLTRQIFYTTKAKPKCKKSAYDLSSSFPYLHLLKQNLSNL